MATTYINFHALVNIQTVQNLMAAISQKLMMGTTEFYFLISTPGGQVMSGMTLYNFLRALPVPITMHNIGNVDSIGNAIYVAADQRFACPHSTFMGALKNSQLEPRYASVIGHGMIRGGVDGSARVF